MITTRLVPHLVRLLMRAPEGFNSTHRDQRASFEKETIVVRGRRFTVVPPAGHGYCRPQLSNGELGEEPIIVRFERGISGSQALETTGPPFKDRGHTDRTALTASCDKRIALMDQNLYRVLCL